MDKINKSSSFIGYANSFQAVTVPGLERIGELCRLLGEPQRALKFVHVAGTNGKGSVCASLACILEDAGLRTGKYISPNLIKVNERISVSGKDISDSELEGILARIEPLCPEVERSVGTLPTQFEIWTAAAFLYFKEQMCDIVILEVGLGGELDATNIIEENELAIITRLGLDHTQYLGNTLTEVARAKCGIMKHSCKYKTVITANQDPCAMAVIKNTASSLGHTVSVPDPIAAGAVGTHERLILDGKEYLCGIAGLHQIENAALAIYAARRLGISEEAIASGILRAKNPARFELLSENPPIIYDGGHNENGIEALNRSIERYFKGYARTVIFACMADKEIENSLKMLSAGDTRFIFTEVKNNPRAMSAEALAEKAAEYGFNGVAVPDIGEAYEKAKGEGLLTVICGSLYLYKDLREYLDKILK